VSQPPDAAEDFIQYDRDVVLLAVLCHSSLESGIYHHHPTCTLHKAQDA